jgi:hypothetical protein
MKTPLPIFDKVFMLFFGFYAIFFKWLFILALPMRRGVAAAPDQTSAFVSYALFFAFVLIAEFLFPSASHLSLFQHLPLDH